MRTSGVSCSASPTRGAISPRSRPRAEKRGGVYVVTGQKVWSSYARFADWGIALVRTDPSGPKHQGISMLAIPMTSTGVDVRPLRQINGECEFNEVFLDGVEIPVGNLIGAENEGWAVASTTLANERGATFVWKEQVLLARALDLLMEAGARSGRVGDPIVRQRLAQAWLEVEIFRSTTSAPSPVSRVARSSGRSRAS